MKQTLTLILIVLMCTSISCNSHEESKNNTSYINYCAIKKYPKAFSYVSDFEGILTEVEEKYLDSLLRYYDETTSNQIAVVTIKTIDPYESIMNFSMDLGNYWGVGQANINNGIVIAISKNMKQIAISTGYGAEKILSDDLIKIIIDYEMIPYFRTEQYFGGIKNGVYILTDAWINHYVK